MSVRRKTIREVAVLAAMAVLIAACGGGGGDGASDVSPTTEAPPTTAEATTTSAPTTTVAPTTTEAQGPVGVELRYALLDAGSCYLEPGHEGEELFTGTPIEPSSCEEPYDSAVVSKSTFDGFGDEYPGVDALLAAGDEVCAADIEAFTGVPSNFLEDHIFLAGPTETEWEHGDRTLVCEIYLGGSLMIGSVAGAGLEAPGVAAITMANGPEGDTELLFQFQHQRGVPLAPSPGVDEETVPVGVNSQFSVFARFNEAGTRDIYAYNFSRIEVLPALVSDVDTGAVDISPDGDFIVFVATSDAGIKNLVLASTSTGDVLPLTDTPDWVGSPRFSPDGNFVVYSSRVEGGPNNIYAQEIATGATRQLTDDAGNDFDPMWSPDGSMLAFTSDRSGNVDIWVAGTGGENPVNVTNHPAEDAYPSWTFDSQMIMFETSRLAEPTTWIMLPDGSEQSFFTVDIPAARPRAYGPVL